MSTLRDHDVIHDGVGNFKCDQCSKDFSRKAQLNKHVDVVHNNVRKHKCEMCEKLFGSKSDLVQHTKVNHSVAEKGFKESSQDLAGEQNLEKAELKSSPLVNNSKPDINTKIPQNATLKTIICALCNKYFTKKSSLNCHVSNVHEKKKNYTCDKCGKEFFKKSPLIDHNNSHEGIRNSKCGQCPKEFVRKGDLKIHVE